MSGEIVTVFRSRLRDDAGDDYERTAAEMERRARAMPGFVDLTTFVAADGERLSLIVFASRAAHDAWRNDAEHGVAQRRGRDEWYSSYAIRVCEAVAERTFTR